MAAPPALKRLSENYPGASCAAGSRAARSCHTCRATSLRGHDRRGARRARSHRSRPRRRWRPLVRQRLACFYSTSGVLQRRRLMQTSRRSGRRRRLIKRAFSSEDLSDSPPAQPACEPVCAGAAGAATHRLCLLNGRDSSRRTKSPGPHAFSSSCACATAEKRARLGFVRAGPLATTPTAPCTSWSHESSCRVACGGTTA